MTVGVEETVDRAGTKDRLEMSGENERTLDLEDIGGRPAETDREIRVPRPSGSGTGPSWLSLRYHPIVGSPVCLVFLHGFGSSQDGSKVSLFRERAQRDGLSFCSFDFQGHGRSGGSLRELTPERNLDDLGSVLDLLRSLGQERFVLVGSSMGAATAMWWAVRRPQGLVAAVLVAPAIDMAAGLERRLGSAAIERWLREGELRLATERGSAPLGWQFLDRLRRLDSRELVERYRVPSLIFQGMRDETVPWKRVAELVSRLDCPCELVLFSDGDHRLNDRRHQLWQRTRDFLDARGPER